MDASSWGTNCGFFGSHGRAGIKAAGTHLGDCVRGRGAGDLPARRVDWLAASNSSAVRSSESAGRGGRFSGERRRAQSRYFRSIPGEAISSTAFIRDGWWCWTTVMTFMAQTGFAKAWFCCKGRPDGGRCSKNGGFVPFCCRPDRRWLTCCPSFRRNGG